MAQILVAADRRRAGQRWLLDATVDAVRSDGHEATAAGDQIGRAVEEADAVVALEADADSVAAACLAAAVGHRKPTLHLHGGTYAIPAIAGLATQDATVHDRDGLDRALAGFYDAVRPFAGRLVRDRIPHLVKEAGHDVRFRALEADEKPRFLKQKLVTEAQQLQRADAGKEKEELGDLLEVLEAFIRVRGYDREDLKMVKQAKHKRRGGFERCYVVESTAPAMGAAAPEETAAADPTDAAAEAPLATGSGNDSTQTDEPRSGHGVKQVPLAEGVLPASFRDVRVTDVEDDGDAPETVRDEAAASEQEDAPTDTPHPSRLFEI